jgi:hypothetical protein
MTLDDAISISILSLKAGDAAQYGYDLYPSFLADVEAHRVHGHGHEKDQYALKISHVFFDAAWELCRRGLLRPGVRSKMQQAVPEGGYSLTIAGSEKLANLDESSIIVMQPGALAAALSAYRDRFGDAFHARSQEAIKCRNAEAWLACCAMAGAAAESVLLSVAIAKTADETGAYKKYNATGGRQKILSLITANLPDRQKENLSNFTGIISLWRDEAAHGAPTELTTANADESMRQLLHMCQWVVKHWEVLTA